jgi:hypothetical protein
MTSKNAIPVGICLLRGIYISQYNTHEYITIMQTLTGLICCHGSNCLGKKKKDCYLVQDSLPGLYI